ncbi:hypothetical protein R6U77_00580 [Lysinibacillus louembei]|uniref:YfjL-like C-terminal domain-containing protein n=1 Tax=Lysinibacillus louembei TaxID=1470088 RepID=A0ABZ0RZA2_9BACI|nr:hypothetical protein [Lysinibacillus louembei]WPK12215.1 hypothetical protein R6U77_00580 [Lysinibacillus louembei]
MPKNIVDFTLHYDSTDGDISQQWSEESSKYVQDLLQELPIRVSVTYSIQVPIDLIKSQPYWKPNISLPVKPSIYIESSFYDGETKEDFLQLANEVQQRLNNSDMLYDSVLIMTDEEFDNSDGSKKGYASTYYESRYRVLFKATDKITARMLY